MYLDLSGGAGDAGMHVALYIIAVLVDQYYYVSPLLIVCSWCVCRNPWGWGSGLGVVEG